VNHKEKKTLKTQEEENQETQFQEANQQCTTQTLTNRIIKAIVKNM
jgi:hypothetical protein